MSHLTKWQKSFVRQQGISLVEIMIAVTISIVLLAGVGKIFVSSKQTYRAQDALSRIQESGRFAADFLTKDIRMAGYTGCNTLTPPVNFADLNANGVADPFTDFTTQSLAGYEYDDLTATLTSTVNLTGAEVVEDTDVIVIMNAAPSSNVQLFSDLTPASSPVVLAGTAAGLFQSNDILLISDCTKADIFATNNVANGANVTISHTTATNTSGSFPSTYSTDAMVMKINKVAYYIGTNANGNPALFRKRLTNGSAMATEELAEGVEDMQIQYGEDLDGDGVANRYVDADTAGLNMANVVSVRFGLLVQTVEDNIATKAQDYTFTGQLITPDDRRLRRAFYTVTKLRNRGIL